MNELGSISIFFNLFIISWKMGTGLLGSFLVQVCTVLRPLLLGQSTSALK